MADTHPAKESVVDAAEAAAQVCRRRRVEAAVTCRFLWTEPEFGFVSSWGGASVAIGASCWPAPRTVTPS